MKDLFPALCFQKKENFEFLDINLEECFLIYHNRGIILAGFITLKQDEN